MQTLRHSPGFVRRSGPKVIGLCVGLTLWAVLGLTGLSADWRAGAAIILGFAAMFVAARFLGVSAASLWWWPLRDPSQVPQDDSRGRH
jgi:hypothetical protein